MVKQKLKIYIILLLSVVAIKIISCSIPTYMIQENIEKSCAVLKREGISYGGEYNIPSAYDDATEVQTLQVIISGTKNYPAYKAAFLDIQMSWWDEEALSNLAIWLERTLNDTLGGAELYVVRHWHGAGSLLRFLYIFFDILQIRMLAFYACILLTIVVVIKLIKIDKSAGIAFMLSVCCIDLYQLCWTVNSCAVFMLSLVTMSWFLSRKKYKEEWTLNIFFLTGALTSFFDLMSAPILSYGLLMFVSIILCKFEKIVDIILFWLKAGFNWIIGYILFWAAEWLFASIATKRNVFLECFYELLFNLNGNDEFNPTIMGAIKYNFSRLTPAYFLGERKNMYFFVTLFCISIILTILTVVRTNKGRGLIYLQLICLSLIPIGWLIVAKAQSLNYNNISYRILLVSVMSLIYVCVDCIRQINIKRVCFFDKVG